MNKIYKLLATIFFLTSAIYAQNPESTFKQVTKNYQFSFPKDHGAHWDYPVEWWYFTGHLKNQNKQEFGVQLTFFRVGLKSEKGLSTKWQPNNIYLAHAALSDIKNKKFHHFEKTSRGAFKTAGASSNNLNVWLSNWSAKEEGGMIHLYFKADNTEFKAKLKPSKPISLQGQNGFSKKGKEDGNASLYMSYTRLNGDGVLKLNTEEHNNLNASFWMDHEVLSSFKSFDNNNNKRGWDWFSIQFDNNTELMLYQIKNPDGTPTGYSSGNFIGNDNQNQYLKKSDFTIKELSKWTSPKTDKTYPSKWKITVPSKNLELTILPEFNAQELDSKNTNQTYWEGKCKVLCNDKKCGKAYVELVGY